MFREFLRKKNEILIEEIKGLFRLSQRGISAINGDNGYPYAISINYF